MGTRSVWMTLVLLAMATTGTAQDMDTADDITVQASLRIRGEAWDWFGSGGAGEYGYVGSILRAGAGQRGTTIGWQADVAVPVLLGLPDDAVEPAPRGQLGLGPTYFAANGGDRNVAGFMVRQAYLRMGVVGGETGHRGQVGRFEFVEGAEVAPRNPTLQAVKRDRIAHRLLGNFGWSHAGRSLEGIQYGYSAPVWNVTALAARPVEGVFDVNGWKGLDVAVGYGAVTRRDQEDGTGEARVFAIHYRDGRSAESVVKADNRPPAVRQADSEDVTIRTVGAHYLRAEETAAGTIDLMAWGAFQNGRWGAQDHRAWSLAAEIGIQPGEVGGLRPWIRVGHNRGSGDSNPADDRHETFFQMLPTPRIYARFPFYNGMNLSDTFLSAIVRPAAAITIRSDVRRLRLTSAADGWYAGGGAFDQESFGYGARSSGGFSGLGTLADVSVQVRHGAWLTVTAYAGRAWGGDVLEQIYPDDQGGMLGYLEMELRH